ncbi:hypothetical protein BH10ACI1_BH10ACI1_28420 [soil metagenome]
MEVMSFVGQTLDDKYKIEREIGRGGMGTVYLATHVGTERPVALKIIAPQFMQRTEFVERFRREARAAGRLRHPNVVDVTDFGFAESKQGNVAYLVMEYLDGVTLGEVLEEERKLPLGWSLDILEQVCSAVHEAHSQGIIHRDLKPDNIWLEPNQRGGYTVKVLDFGIAKLEENVTEEMTKSAVSNSPVMPTSSFKQMTSADSEQSKTIVENKISTVVSEAGTILQTDNLNALNTEAGTILQTDWNDSEDKTAILASSENETVSIEDNFGTKLISAQIETGKSLINTPGTKDLTRVGAVLGTPLYMSPEQCRGERLGQSSDIYSLGVIAYQMLSGGTPFTGDFKEVMKAHKETLPPPLTVKKIPRKVRKVIHSALAKNTEERPPTADAFASELRSQSEGIWTLLRRALVIYSAHLPKFLGLTTFFLLPVIFFTFTLIGLSFLKVSNIINSKTANAAIGINSLLLTVLTTYCTSLIVGATTWIVAQYLAVPLRPVLIRQALMAVKKKWKAVAWTGILKAIIGIATCGIGLLIGEVIWSLYPSIVMMENLSGWKALKRSTTLVWRSLLTTIAAVFILLIVPAIISGFIYFVVNVTAQALENQVNNTTVSRQQNESAETSQDKEKDFSIHFGNGRGFKFNEDGKDMQTRVIETLLASVIQIFWLPMHIFVASFTSIILALLYLKTRQTGGESMMELLEQFEETDNPQSNWQKRVRERLIQSGRITSRSS